MDSVKNRGRPNKLLFMCFRSVVVEEGSVDSNQEGGSGDPVLAYITVEGKERMVIPKIVLSLSDKNSKKACSDGCGGGGCYRKKKRFSRTISSALKAVLFETSLAKKVRRRASQAKTQKVSSSVKENSSEDQSDKEMNSSRRTSLYSSSATVASSSFPSTSSSISSNSRTESFRANLVWSKQADGPAPAKEGEGFWSNIGIYLMLVCLLVLILWGKALAILCTSACLYLAPGRIKKALPSPAGSIDSPEQRKRVIMEGLLERGRGRRCRVAL